MIEWIGELAVDARGAIVGVDEAVRRAIGAIAPSALEQQLGGADGPVLSTPARATRIACFALGARRQEWVARRVRGEPGVRLGMRRDPVEASSPLALAAAAGHRALVDLAHDLGGAVTGIVAAIDGALAGSPGDDGHEALREARAEALRIVALARCRAAVLACGRGESETVELRARLAATLASLAPELERACLEAKLDAEEAPVRLEASSFDAVVVGLMLNAIDASRGRAKHVQLRARLVGRHGLRARIEVEDRGRGMDRDAIERAGELFHTSRRTGAGLGLAAIRQAVLARGGILALESEQNAGTLAIVELPVAAAAGDER